MCGIVGYVDSIHQDTAEDLRATVNAMAGRIIHRGPDHGNCWADEKAGVALAYRRLAVVDLTPEGNQPMSSGDGRYVMVYNGEVYNFGDIRQDLIRLGHVFRGSSDTEVMLAAFQEWGIEAALGRFVGMFAFALFDRFEQALYLVRDRLGVKPLYFGWVNHTLFFGSELKALCAHPRFDAEINRESVALYFRYGYIPSPSTIYKNIFQVKPGQYFRVQLKDKQSTGNLVTYWSGKEIAQHGIDHPFQGSEQDALERLEDLLRDAVRIRMIADVPLGAFLSGGIDSSLVVALMQAQSNLPINTFTIGFDDKASNEAEYAKAVARHLGTKHTELYLAPDDMLDVITRLPTIYDEPFADSSQIPTYLLSELTRRHVTVSLSGDGGDELFAGYTGYTHSMALWQYARIAPPFVRSLSALMTGVSPKQWDCLLRPVARNGDGLSGRRIRLALDILRQFHSREQLYQLLGSQWLSDTRVVRDIEEPLTSWTNRADWLQTDSYLSWMQALDLITYLPDDILVKLDRASMAVSLEAREPLLDHRIVEFAWSLQSTLKIRDGQSKWPLRQILYKFVPRELVDRPKKGFSIPLEKWLRGPLRDWAETLLDPQRISQQGLLNESLITARWTKFIGGEGGRERDLWTALMFQAWLEAQS